MSGLKLVLNTNKCGLYFLLAAACFQIWVDYSAPTSSTCAILDQIRTAVLSLWSKIWIETFREDDMLIHSVGTTVWVLASWLLLNTPFLVVDLVGCPAWLKKHRIQDTADKHPDFGRIKECLKVDLINMGLINFLVNLVTYPATCWIGCLHTGELPTFGNFVLQIAVFRILEEFGNYYTHRLLHEPGWYQYHKKHHEWKAPMSIVSAYSGPYEHVLSNILPVLLGPVLCRSHLFVAWTWASFTLVSTTIEHCGFHLPFLYPPQGHDYHHKTFTCWYGTMAFLDVLHGTDKPFSGTVDGRRQFISTCLTPVKLLVTDKGI